LGHAELSSVQIAIVSFYLTDWEEQCNLTYISCGVGRYINQCSVVSVMFAVCFWFVKPPRLARWLSDGTRHGQDCQVTAVAE